MSDAYERILVALDAEDRVDHRNGRQSTARCPAHDDGQASLSVGLGDGRALLHCHAGCDALDVLAALGLDWPDTFDGDPPKRYTRAGLRRAGATLEPDGRIRVGAVRYLPGAATGQRKSQADAGSQREVHPDPASVPGDDLWVVEGEGDLLTAATLDLPAVAMPGASFKLTAEKAASIASGRRRVVIVSDCDGPGRTAAARWAGALAEHCADVRVLDLHPDREDGADLSDFAADAHDDHERAQAHELLVDLAEALHPARTEEVDGAPGSTWTPVELASIVDAIGRGEDVGPAPSLMPRADGPCLLYRGELHSFAAEPESGKTWILLSEGGRLLEAGERVLYLDFEDTPANVVGRLLALNVSAAAIVERFVLVRPDESLASGAIDRLLARGPFALAVIDGVTEALNLLGLTTDNVDIPKFRAHLGRPLARSGAATVEIDHVTKDAATRGRYAIGGQHKLAGVAVAYSVKALQRPSRTRAGLLKLTVEKDRHGRIREHEDASHTIALAHIEPAADGRELVVRLAAPDAGQSGLFRPTHLMERVSEHVARNPGSTVRRIKEAVKGNAEARDLALELLIDEQFVERRIDGQAHRHHHLRDFREQDDEKGTVPPSPDRPSTVPGEGGRAPSPRSPSRKGTGDGDQAARPAPTVPRPPTSSLLDDAATASADPAAVNGAAALPNSVCPNGKGA